MKLRRTFAIIMLLTMLISSVAFAGETNGDGERITVPSISGGGSPEMDNVAGKVLGLIKYIAIAVAFGMVFIIGMKYMTASAGGKAEVKTTMLPYLIGAICVGAASAIAEFALNLGA